MTRLTTREIEFILEPIFSSTVESLGLRIPTDSENLEREDLLKVLKRYDARKVFRIMTNLVDRGKIMDKIAEEYEEEMGADEIDARITVFVNRGLLLRIVTPEMKLQLLPSYKLLITPLGILFLYCYRKGLFHRGETLDENISFTQRLLGSVYEDFVQNEVHKSLLERQVSLSKKEIAISLLLLLSQAVTRERALKISKSEREVVLVNLTESLNRIGKSVFNESELFRDAQETNNAIRRSTGVSGLEGKMFGLYSKRSSEGEDILYFKCKEEELLSIVSRICESIKNEREKDNVEYEKTAIKLIDKHIKDRNFLFSPWVHRKFLDHEAETVYLQKLLGLFKREFS